MNENTIEVEDRILDHGGWDRFTYQNDGFVDHFTGVTLVKIFKGNNLYDSYGEYPMGYEGEAYLVFEYDNRFYKKLGTVDSYGEIVWDGKFREVQPTQKVVVEYEW